MPRYFQLTTGWHPDRVDAVTARSPTARSRPSTPSGCSPARSSTCTTARAPATQAEPEFDRVFRDHAAPAEVPERRVRDRGVVDGRLAHLLHLASRAAVPSNKEGRRMIEQGGVRLDGEVVTDPDLEVAPTDVDGVVLQVGKRNWARVRA